MEQTQQEQQKSETEKSSEVLGVDKIQGVAKELKVDPKVLLDKFLPIIEEITKSKIDDKVAVVKDQLYKTIEQLKLGKTDSDAKLAELNEYVQKIKDAEAASLKKLEDDKVAEQEEKKTTKQRLAELSEKLENQASNYEKKLLAIKLSGIRKEAIALAQNSIIPELIPDPEVTDISLENLLKAIEFSKAKFLEIAALIIF